METDSASQYSFTGLEPDSGVYSDEENDLTVTINHNDSPFSTDPVPVRASLETETSDPYTEECRTQSNEWCTCGRCHPQETNEFVCCRELDAGTVCDDECVDCITVHDLFQLMCLHRRQLQVRSRFLRNERPFYMERCSSGDTNRALRYTAYREFVVLVHGRGLGAGQRRRIPGCALRRIR
ncbi:uncharacterized protein LOC135393336 [Ornithodoros turicata]|uniref:uncharacterized protein LOC135393336 n=1 Tax=Ornithodoros turicata TaxID=34597 RepID=UPI00313930A1